MTSTDYVWGRTRLHRSEVSKRWKLRVLNDEGGIVKLWRPILILWWPFAFYLCVGHHVRHTTVLFRLGFGHGMRVCKVVVRRYP